MRFTFLVHPLNEWMLRFFGARNLLFEILRAPLGKGEQFAFRQDMVRPITLFPQITSDQGHTCSGQVIGIPSMPGPMLSEQAASVDIMRSAIESYGEDSDLVGLGALCAVVGLRGMELADQVKVPVTTGNSLTCWAAAETTQKAFQLLTQSERFSPRVLIVGLPGTMAAGLMEVLATRGLPVEVFHRSYPKPLVRKIERLEKKTGAAIKRWDNLDEALKAKGIVVGAGSIGGELADANLRPGTVVVDVAQPLDTTPAQRKRGDLLVLEGELLALPRATDAKWRSFWSSLYNTIVGQDSHHVFACLAEPMVLCLEGRPESFSLGKRLSVDRVEEIGALAKAHGFGVRSLISGRTPQHPEDLQRFAQIPWLP